jgi:hypothetical protein
MRPPLEQKFTNRRNGQCLDALPLEQNYITTILAGLHPTTLVIRTSRGWEAEGLEEEAKE